jgi:hypothetical protein
MLLMECLVCREVFALNDFVDLELNKKRIGSTLNRHKAKETDVVFKYKIAMEKGWDLLRPSPISTVG